MTELVWWKRGETKPKKTKTIKRKRSKEKKTRPILKRGKSKPKKTKTVPKRKKEGPLLSSFEYFDPLKSELPDSLLTGFGDTVKRARKILEKTGKIEIEQMLKKISETIRKGTDTLSLRSEIEKLKESGERSADISYTEILRRELERNDISGKDRLDDNHRARYFAVLALAQVGGAHHKPEAWGDGESPDIDERPPDPQFVLDAKDAVRVAEKFRAKAATIRKLLEERSAKSRPGGVAKSKLARDLKNKARKIYFDEYADRNISNRQAAVWVWKKIGPDNERSDGRPILSERNAPETIAKWIAKWKKEIEQP